MSQGEISAFWEVIVSVILSLKLYMYMCPIPNGTWRVARLYSTLHSEIALSRKPFGIGHMYIYTFWFRMTDTMTSLNTDRSFWDTPYIQRVASTRIANLD
jgi:cytochrome b subunit of formate dehydrogenase